MEISQSALLLCGENTESWESVGWGGKPLGRMGKLKMIQVEHLTKTFGWPNEEPVPVGLSGIVEQTV